MVAMDHSTSVVGNWPESQFKARANRTGKPVYCPFVSVSGQPRNTCTCTIPVVLRNFRLVYAPNNHPLHVSLRFYFKVLWSASWDELLFLNRSCPGVLCASCAELLRWSQDVSILLRNRTAYLPASLIIQRVWSWYFQEAVCDCDATLPPHLQTLRLHSRRCIAIQCAFTRHSLFQQNLQLELVIRKETDKDTMQLVCDVSNEPLDTDTWPLAWFLPTALVWTAFIVTV